MTPLRNLLVIAINQLIASNKIELISAKDSPEPKGHLLTVIAGKKSVINWQGIGSEEIRVSVWWDYDHSNHPQANLEDPYRECFQTSKPVAKSQYYPKFIGAMVSGWLERKTSKHLQGENNNGLYDKYIRRNSKTELDGIPYVKAKGFDDSGKFFK